MATFKGKIENNQIRLIVDVSVPQSQNAPMAFHALLDTGAQSTCISPQVVKDLALAAVGDAALFPASGEPIPVLVYRANIAISITSVFATGENHSTENFSTFGKELDVMLLPYQPHGFNVLLGMDLISLFHITLFADQFLLSN